MKHSRIIKAFIPSDIQRVATRIRHTWTKLSDQEINYYLKGQRQKLLKIMQKKYGFSADQAETALSCIERLTTYSYKFQ